MQCLLLAREEFVFNFTPFFRSVLKCYKEENMKTIKSRISGILAAMALAAGLSGPATAQEDTFKIGVITFLSGQAAESFRRNHHSPDDGHRQT